ncbi:isoaspartyl peptidase/L-asparaginase isoform X4 [Heterocephalus glaber]|uniref:Isoaspartyl peptidase/L-asparaginase isoform X4 n=1 Tax=Heterocephalus glaber TaxID=10181 RepID=A0AAX6SF32_HETGA|nr:isoaspartyl peptidase/L-asparaginase isoform X4 [Heterocephalus glaber]
MEPVLVVHGGSAGCIPCERRPRVRQGVIRAASLGHGVLRAGGSAVDAVEAAVAALEDDPEFNAGRGSVLTEDGEVEMDASIMDGRDLATGAVSAVRCISNPIKLARLVMDKTPHCFLTDRGAAKFAADMGIPEIPGEQLVTERSRKHLEKERQEKGAPNAACPQLRRLRRQQHRSRVHHGTRREHPEGEPGPACSVPPGARKDGGRGCGAGAGLHEVEAQSPGRPHPGQQDRALGGKVDLRLHALGGCEGWQGARWHRPRRQHRHGPVLSQRRCLRGQRSLTN